MKKITQLGRKEFFAAIYNLAEETQQYADLIDLKAIRSVMPDLTGEETDEEKAKLMQEQGAKNLIKILQNALIEHPDETEHLMLRLVEYTPEEMEKLSGIEFLTNAMNVIGEKAVQSFFMSFLRAAQTVSKL